MRKNISLKIITSLMLLMVTLKFNVFADEVSSEDNANNNDENINKYEEFANYVYDENGVELTEEQKITNLKSANDAIDELFETLKDKLSALDESVEYLRTTGEYDNYPAIRLNLDTPIFGLSSIIEQKLKISKDVSPNDIADGYSIRSITKNSYIKLPDSYIAGILISTYDVDLKNDIKLSNANLVILKLTQYINKVDEVEKFLDTQINKFFRGYIDKEKLNGISDIETKIARQKQELLNVSDSIIKQELLGNVEKYNEFATKYIEYQKKLCNLKDELSDTLMDKDTLNEYKKQMISLESDILNFTTDVSKNEIKNENITDEMMLQILKNAKIKFTEMKDGIEEYSTSSTYEKKVKINEENIATTDSKNQVEENLDEKNLSDTSSSEESSFSEQVKLYSVINTNVKSNLESYISEIDVMIKNIEEKIASKSESEEKKDESIPNEENNNDFEDGNTSFTLTGDELDTRNEMISNVLRLYKESLSKQNKFYLSNINNMLKEVTSKISDLSKYTNADIYANVKYVYIDIPVLLVNYVDSSDNSYICQKDLIYNLQKELDNMTKTYISVNMIYQKMQVDELKQKD